MRTAYMLTTAIISALSISAEATQYSASATNIVSVLGQAKGGDTVTLSGTFGKTNLGGAYASMLTIDASAASFTDSLVLRGMSNVNFVGGHYGSATAVTAYNAAALIYGGNNVTFTNPYVSGYYIGQGLVFSGSTNATVTGATFSKLNTSVLFNSVKGGSITNSRSIGATSDGFDISNSSHIDIGHNQCLGSTPVIGAHPDCVQLWSNPGYARQDHIAIHDNYASGATQGITNFGSSGIGSDFISMTNNRIDSLMSQGIACFLCVDSTITGNTVTSLDGAEFQDRVSVLSGQNNTVFGNTIGAWNRAAARPTKFYDRADLISGKAFARSITAPGGVPEPQEWTLLIAGFAVVGLCQRRRPRIVAA